jgi:exopolysaccharide biosynthesis polyprenyl glycosylphosphotransferase
VVTAFRTSEGRATDITWEASGIVEPVQNLQPQVVPERGLHWSGPRRALPDIASETSHLKLDTPAEGRLHLQRRAPENLRHHVWRAAVRLVVLIVGDMAAFGVMRALVRLIRDDAVLGASLADQLQWALPTGMLNGWQYATALFVGLIVLGNYGPGDQRRDPKRLFAAAAFATALPLWGTLWTRGAEPVLLQYAATVVLVWLGLAMERFTINRIAASVWTPEKGAVDTLFVGRAAECIGAASSPAFATGTEYRPIGFVDVQVPPAPGALGHVSEIPLLLAASGAQVVALCGYLRDKEFQDVVDAALAGGCQVLAVPRAAEIAGVHPTTVWRRGQPLVELTAPSLKGWQLFLKRLLDLVGASVGLLLLSPPIALIGVAIKLESRGPIIFGHARLGANGRRFKCYKFRSMHPEADQRLRSDAELYATYVANGYKLPEEEDTRLTRVGRFLRKTSLDEIPQLINVFRGEMSLVGPRPIVPEELERYGHGAAVLLSLKPGMTGAWAVNGRSHVGYPDRADMELDYVRNWSLAFDLWILLRTVPAVLVRRGAH